VVQKNAQAITDQLKTIFENANQYLHLRFGSDIPTTTKPKFVNNLSWFKTMSMLQFIGDIGRLARVSIMMSRDSVKSRLSSPEGISFTEFSYQLLQAYDFYHLYRTENCKIQIGGSDQWGNIVAGLEFIRKKHESSSAADTTTLAHDAVGLTIPLVTTSTGEKFGKSAGNAIWLDPSMTSIFDFYQVLHFFLLRSSY
jgi:tyrosyl-tRNA synthetase